MPINRAILFLVAVLIALVAMTASAWPNQSRDFPLPQGLVTDFAGALTPNQMDQVHDALEESYRANGMDGHIIIALNTDEWYLDEYVKDYADFLQGRGLINREGWLLYLSKADRKFALAVQDLAAESITLPCKQEIALIMSERLEAGDIAGAVLNAVTAIGEMPAPQTVREQRKMSPDMLIFMGVVVMVIGLMLRLRFAGRASLKTAK